MAPHLYLTRAAVEVLLVSGSSYNTVPPSTSCLHPSMRQRKKVCTSVCVKRCVASRRRLWCGVVISPGHRDCLELLLSCGAPVDVELPELGTPLYSACRADAPACVEVLLRSGESVKSQEEEREGSIFSFACFFPLSSHIRTLSIVSSLVSELSRSCAQTQMSLFTGKNEAQNKEAVCVKTKHILTAYIRSEIIQMLPITCT